MNQTPPIQLPGYMRSDNVQLLLENGQTPVGYFWYGRNSPTAEWDKPRWATTYHQDVSAPVVGWAPLEPYLAEIHKLPMKYEDSNPNTP